MEEYHKLQFTITIKHYPTTQYITHTAKWTSTLCFVLLKSSQNDDNSVTCSWDFSDSGYTDSEGYEKNLSVNDLTLQALYAPDRVNPLITQLPKELQFEIRREN